MTAALKRILEETERLSEKERSELRALLQEMCRASQPASETAFEQALAAEGLLSLPSPAPANGELGPPIEAPGRLLSEILLEERR